MKNWSVPNSIGLPLSVSYAVVCFRIGGCTSSSIIMYAWSLFGFIGLIGYLIGFYLTLSTDIHISQLYLPTVCRGFAYAVLSATFMVCLEEIMTFQHFFQGLSVFNMLHMVVGGVVGAAVYAQGLAYYVPDNLARYGSAIDHVAFSSSPFNLGHYMEEFISQMMEISIKQIYGWVAYACIFLFLLLLLYDFPARRSLKNIPSWKEVAREVKNTFWRTTHTVGERKIGRLFTCIFIELIINRVYAIRLRKQTAVAIRHKLYLFLTSHLPSISL